MSVEFFRGPQASGKTSRCADLARDTLDKGGSVIYVDAEISQDPGRVHTWVAEENRLLYTQERDPEFVLQVLESFAPKYDLAIIDGISFTVDELSQVSRIARESDTAVWITKQTSGL